MSLSSRTENVGVDSLEQIIHDSSFLSTLLGFSFWNVLDWSSFLLDCLVHFSLFLLLGLHLFDVSISDFFFGNFKEFVSCGVVLLLLSSDFIEGHADNSLLDSGSSSGSLLLDVFNLDFLVESSGSLGPGKLDWLDLLVEKSSGFGGNEKVDFTIFTGESSTSTWVNFQFSECARIGLDNHLS